MQPLTIYRPAAETTDSKIGLGEFFDLVLQRRLTETGRAADTIQQYKRHVHRWNLFCEKYRISNPVLDAIDAGHLAEFRNYLTAAGFSNRNANKYLGGVQAILTAAAAAGVRKNPPPQKLERLPERAAAAKLYLRFLTRAEIEAAERAKMAGSGDELKKLLQRDELGRLHQAARVATWPAKNRDGEAINPVHQWQAAIVLFCLYGFRTRELIATSWRHTPIAWRNVVNEIETPDVSRHATNESGWLYYVPAKQRRFKPRPLVLPLHRAAADHLSRLNRLAIEQPVFNWPRCSDQFYATWQAIIAAAGLAKKIDLETGRPITWQPCHLRKTCVTWHSYHRAGVAELITGHAKRSVIQNHYDNATLSLCDHFQALPIPEQWRI